MKNFYFISLALIPTVILALESKLDLYLLEKLDPAYQEYKIKCLNKQDWRACENSKLELIIGISNQNKSNKMSAKYPKREVEKGRNAIVELFLEIEENGEVNYISTIKSVCGFGDIYLQTDWSKDDCNAFIKSSKDTIKNWSFDPVLINGEPIKRMFAHRFTFLIEDSTSQLINNQIVDLKDKDLRRLNRVIKKNNHKAMIAFAKDNVTQHPIYYYYLASSSDQIGQTEEAIKYYLRFLEETGDRYFYYSNFAKMRSINLLYFDERYEEVAEIYDDEFAAYIKKMNGGDQFLIAHMLAASSKLIVGEDIKALKMFLDLKNKFSLYTKDESLRNTLIKNSEIQIEQIIDNTHG
jgi:tetratricopeptide (TPR) repeat protein